MVQPHPARPSQRMVIKTNAYLRDPRLERRVMESYRDDILYFMLLFGLILLLVVVMW